MEYDKIESPREKLYNKHKGREAERALVTTLSFAVTFVVLLLVLFNFVVLFNSRLLMNEACILTQ